MHKITLLLLFLLNSILLTGQIKGKIVDKNNETLPYVNIYLKNDLTGTTTNDNGLYELSLKKQGEYTIVFQFLGFKTIEKKVVVTSFPFELNVKMIPEEVLLNEVAISSKENPANRIIRNVIANKEKNTNKSGKYTADFYSRGLFKIKDAPKKILGQEIGDLGGGLDSTRSGIIYLSETVSKITYQKKPKKFKEVIVASKVSGQNNGISFNRADEVNFNLYENLVTIGDTDLFSPISDYAFSHYKFKLEGNFYDKNGKNIHKIKIIPKRENDRVFSGYIYIVEDDWAVYGADINATGTQINNPAIDILHLKQDYNYDAKTQIWALILQTIDFKIGFLSFKVGGRFSASYTNYNFEPIYTENSFGKEILSFEKDALKKDSVYWNKLRPVPLTLEEKDDYIIKDSITIVHKSKKYLDSMDTKSNRFKILSPILGYTYKNSHKKWRLNVGGLIGNSGFNTVQGFNTGLDVTYSKRINDYGNAWKTGININYGFSEKEIRPSFFFAKSWNNFDKPLLNISVGIKISQFDERSQIKNIENTVASLFFKKNYAKFFEKKFAKVSFSKEVTNDIRLFSFIEYANRKPLFNTSNYSFFNKDKTYFTNNPIDRNSTAASFNKHHVFTASASARINFGSKYISYPNARYRVTNKKYPTLFLNYRKTFGASTSNLNTDLLSLKLNQHFRLGNFGNFKYSTKAGLFFNKKDIAFIDYYHPLGNEIHYAPQDRINAFLIMPYYSFSTNDKYAEIHTEHNFKGFLLGKIPLLNKLNFHTVIGAKSYFSGGRKPYTEYSIGLDNLGFGKWRVLRLDYVTSYYNNTKHQGIAFSINIF